MFKQLLSLLGMPLTAEEKKQRKAEKKALKLKEAEELRIKTRKDELSREIKSSQHNVSKYMREWYTRNYTLRFPQIKEDMEVAWSSFEHALDLKDFIISELAGNIDEAKTQEAMSWQDCSIKIDDLLNDFFSRTMKLKKEFEQEVKILVDGAQDTNEINQRSQNELEDYYKTILFMMGERFNEIMATSQGEYVTRRDEESKRGVQFIEEMSGGLEKNLQAVVGDISDTLGEYKTATETRRKELEALKSKDDFYNDMITRQNSKKARLIDEMNALQSQLNEKQESKIALGDLKKDREETYAEYVEARTSLVRDAALDESQLLILTTESNIAIRNLERILEKGEKLLRLGNLCRRLETQEEKVMPFGVLVEATEEIKEQDILNNFLRKFAQANLIKSKLDSILDGLYRENNDLQDNLQTALEIMAMSRTS